MSAGAASVDQALADREILERVGSVSRSVRFQTMGLAVDGEAFDLRRYPFLVELFDSNAQEIVVRKGAQLGFTIACILRTIDNAERRYKRSAIYYMPTRDDVADFSKARFGRLLRENPSLGKLVRGTDSTNMKRVGDVYIYFRGAKSRSQAKSVPADAITFDERDEMDQRIVDLARTRLDGSALREEVSLSTATVPGFGVDYDYTERSDQRTWHIRCQACGAWTCLELDFPGCIERDRDGKCFRACKKCRRPILVLRGQWVPALKDRPVVGYWVSQLCSPRMPLDHIMQEFEDPHRNTAEFYNSRLGLPFADLDTMLDEAALSAVVGNEPAARASKGPCFLGADVGKEDIHWFVGEKRAAQLDFLAFGICAEFSDLYDVAKRFTVEVGVLDEMAETRKVREFIQANPQFWGCWYSDAQRTGYEWNEAERRVSVNRTEILDQSHKLVTQGRCTLPRRDERWTQLVKHMTNLARVSKEDPTTGLPTVRWVVRGKKLDHWRHAFAYAVLAAEQASIAEKESRITRPRHYAGAASWKSA